MNASPSPPAEPVENAVQRRVVFAEDALILVCLALLWLPIAGLGGLLVNLVLLGDLGLMIWLLIRRKRRVDLLFEELRRRQQQGGPLNPYAAMPGLMPPPERPVDQPVGRSRD